MSIHATARLELASGRIGMCGYRATEPVSDDERFSRTVEPHLNAMHRIARDIVRSDDLAWDAVQTVLIRLWRAGTLPEDPRRLLLRRAHLAGLEIHRAQGRRQRHEAGALIARPARTCCGSPLDQLERRESPAHLARLIELMPEECREVFRLRAIDGLPYEAIAIALGVPVGTVRSRLYRARRSLRKRVAA